MSVRKKVEKKLHEWAEKARDKELQKKVKDEVAKRLKQGREAIAKLQAELAKPETKAKAAEQIKRAKAAYVQLKAEAVRRRAQAVEYAKSNPEKALVAAAAIGAAAGALLYILKPKKKR